MEATVSKELIAKTEATAFKALFKTKSYLHAAAMAFNWLIIIGIIYLHQAFPINWLYPVSVIVIGARMHALAILMHDATHFRFLKNRKWNDLLSNFLTMYPLFTSIEKYRANHLQHHQHLNTLQDPDWVAKLTKREFHFPKTKASFLLTICSYLVFYQGILDAVWFLKRFGGKHEETNAKPKHNYLAIGFYMILFLFLTIFNLWGTYLLFWVIPYLTSFFMFQYIRSVAEHFGELAYEDELSSSRTVQPNWIEKILIAPHQVGYHIEHHLYPGVPFYNLPKLHLLLMKTKQYQDKAHITKGYLSGLLKELGRAA